MPTRLIAILLCLAAPAAALADDVQVVVGFHGKGDRKLLEDVGGTVTTELDGAVAGRVPAGALRKLRQAPGVRYVQEDLVRTTCVVPNDTYYAGYQADDLDLIQAPAAWELSKGDGVRVSVLDTGCQVSHPDISGKVKASRNFTTGKAGDVSDKNGHGTHTAGTVGAITNNKKGVAGVGYNCELAIGKVLGPAGGYDSWIAAGIDWSWKVAGAKVISMSLGGLGTSTVLDDAVENAAPNAVLVAAAGNSGANMDASFDASQLEFPGAHPLCVSVAAVDASGTLADFSNYGSTVDVAAPGVNVASTYKGNGYALMSGTSMATPHVAGAAALVWKSAHGTSPDAVRARLTGTSSLSATTPAGTVGILNARAAVE